MNSIKSQIQTLFFIVLTSFSILLAESSSVAGQETLIGIVGTNFIILGADSSLSSSISLTSNTIDKIKIIVDPFPHNERLNIKNRDDMQQVIAIASAGDTADSERIIGQLSGHASSMEFQHIGCDVKCIYRGNNNNLSNTMSSPAGLDAESVAYLARGMIASALRSRGQLKTCLLVAGMVRCHKKLGHVKECISWEGEEESRGNENNAIDTSFSQRIQKQIQTVTQGYIGTKDDVMGMRKVERQTATEDSQSTFLKPKLFWLDEYGSIQSVEYAAHGLASNFALSILDRGYNSNLSKEEAIDLMSDCFSQLRKRFVINCPEPPCIKCIDANGCKIIISDSEKLNKT
mmetsp:Transcript_10483/g.12167  ORF Transcript_10483/g.12167 Transcript_10483/m.12167 type:complete len:346 (+) Transcript_10483:89-1126(+)